MSDIFVSYAHQDREWVARFAESLRQAGGFDIWWDHNILPGEQFDDAIQSAMDQTRCVVVVWSKTSIGSRWVRTEAREAARRNILVPVMNEIVMPPLEFRSFETADMSDWQGDAAHDHFNELVGALRLAIERAAAGNQVSEAAPSMPPPVAPDGYQERRPRALSTRALVLGGAIAAALLIAALAAWLFTKPASPPATALASLGPEASTPVAPPARPAEPDLRDLDAARCHRRQPHQLEQLGDRAHLAEEATVSIFEERSPGGSATPWPEPRTSPGTTSPRRGRSSWKARASRMRRTAARTTWQSARTPRRCRLTIARCSGAVGGSPKNRRPACSVVGRPADKSGHLVI